MSQMAKAVLFVVAGLVAGPLNMLLFQAMSFNYAIWPARMWMLIPTGLLGFIAVAAGRLLGWRGAVFVVALVVSELICYGALYFTLPPASQIVVDLVCEASFVVLGLLTGVVAHRRRVGGSH
jgi:hypothetical protein